LIFLGRLSGFYARTPSGPSGVINDSDRAAAADSSISRTSSAIRVDPE
jgi:hypothetical protein